MVDKSLVTAHHSDAISLEPESEDPCATLSHLVGGSPKSVDSSTEDVQRKEVCDRSKTGWPRAGLE
jgi:hypothetical protein